MTSAHQWLSGISSWLWPILIHHLWQATLFAGAVWVFCLLAKRASSKTRYGIWLLASFKFAVPAVLFTWITPLDIQLPWLTKAISASSTRVVIEFPLTIEAEEQTDLINTLEANTPIMKVAHSELYCTLTLGWALGCLFFLRIWWRGHRTMKMKLRKGKPLISGAAFETLYRAKSLLQERRPIRLLLSSEFPEPGVCGIRKPKLVLPKRVVEALTNQELEAVLLHEVAHVRRRDNLASLLQSWLCCLFWFHPVIWLIDRQLLVERELACDEEALSHISIPEEYLSSLFKVVRSSLGEKLAGASLMTGSNLKRRINHMRSHGSRKNSVLWHRLSISAFVLGLVVSVFGSALLNQKLLVAQPNSESSTFATPSRKEEAPTATLQGSATGASDRVKGEISGGIQNGVAHGIPGGVKRAGPKRSDQPSEPPLRLAVNQTSTSPAPQAGSAKLFGTVSDASRARIPDATIVLADKEGGTKEITFSNAAGEYEFRTLPVSRYSLEVRKPGFRTFQQQALELQPNEPKNFDIVLEVGEVNQTVNVVAQAPAAPPQDVRSGPPRRIRVGGNVQQPKLIHQVQPVYPERAQAQGIQGIVLLEAVILKDGTLGTMRVLSKLPDPDLVDAAIEAVKNWRYEPTLLNGERIEVVTTITVNFRLASS